MRTRSIPVLVCLIAVMTVPLIARARSAGNVVTDWAAMVQPSIHNPASPRSAGTSQILHTMVVLAMYDAAVAIEGGYEPFAATIQAPLGADVRAAVATAAYLTARARVVAAEIAPLDQR
jgi:hypothetical protein